MNISFFSLQCNIGECDVVHTIGSLWMLLEAVAAVAAVTAKET